MKGTLEFNLPEEQDDFLCAQNGLHYKCTVEDMMSIFRRYMKHVEMTKAESKFFNKLYEEIKQVVDWSLFE